MRFSLRAGSVPSAAIGAAIGAAILVIGIVLHAVMLDIAGIAYTLWCAALWYRGRDGGGSRQ